VCVCLPDCLPACGVCGVWTEQAESVVGRRETATNEERAGNR